MTERDRDREDSVASFSPDVSGSTSIMSASSTGTSIASQNNIDTLFEDQTTWEPPKPPQVLGELLDSRYMLPLLFPSDPRMLAVLPGKMTIHDDDRKSSPVHTPDSRSASRASALSRGSVHWRSRNRKLREVGVSTLKWVDGSASISRWVRPVPDDEDEDPSSQYRDPDDAEQGDNHLKLQIDIHNTPLTRQPSGRSKGRPSIGEDQTTPIERLG